MKLKIVFFLKVIILSCIMLEKQLDELLKDVKIDKQRVKKSVDNILQIYDLKPSDISIIRKKIDPSKIYVAAEEECNLDEAKKILKKKYVNILPAPITVLDFKGKYYLFMGSNRSVVYCLKNIQPDCIIVKIPTTSTPIIVAEANKNLKQIIDF